MSPATARITPTTLYLAVAIWVAALPNAVTMIAFAGSRSAGSGLQKALFVAGGGLFVVLVVFLLLVALGLVARARVAKLLCIAVLIAAAALSYFSTFLGTQFERSMVANIAQTNYVEAMELANLRLFAWIAAAGILPAFVVWRWPVVDTGRLRQAATAASVVVVLVMAAGAIIYTQYPRYASAARNREITFATVAPVNVIAGAIHYAAGELATRTVRAPRGVDAHALYAIPKARLLILVIGETARAQNHGLNGYRRDTTPRMREAGGFYFPDTESCGTATTISVPCIFSGLGREDFSLLKGRENETLIDVVKRSGARVIWLDNDSGCKDVCGRAEVTDLTGSKDPRFCPEPGDCHDEILLDGLQARIGTDPRDTLIVLHIKGSHGPAYSRRYPPAFERYSPVCATSDLSACTPEELVNAYDNSILYTDHVIGQAIDILKRVSDRFATALLYVSDHGESLGENGLYLHGMPWAVAPREQKTVPMYSWVSPQFLVLEQWDTECMARQTRVPRSHDNVYATVLGFMEVESVEYKPALDLFEPCDRHRQ